MKPAVQFQDGKGRNLEATIQADGCDWKLWVNPKTKDAVVSQEFKDMRLRITHKLLIPAVFVDYLTVLQWFVDEQTKK